MSFQAADATGSPTDSSFASVNPSNLPTVETISEDLPEEEVVFSDSPAGSVGTIDDPDGMSLGSTFSLEVDESALTGLVDLTDPHIFCMIRMNRIVDGMQIPCVCGQPRASCSRAKHQAKLQAGDPADAGSPGYYEPLSPPSGKVGSDGRLDKRWMSVDEVARARETEAEEKAKDAKAFSPKPAEPTDPPATPTERTSVVSFGQPTFVSPPGPPKAPDIPGNPSVDTVKTGSLKNPPKEKPAPSRRKGATTTAPPGPHRTLFGPTVPVAPPPSVDVPWICMTTPQGRCFATTSAAEVQTMKDKGCAVQTVVSNEKEARKWVNTPPVATGNQGGTIVGPPGPTAPPVTAPTQWAQPASADPMAELLSSVGKHSVGPDPSSGTSTIYGIDPADEARLDGLLMPPSMTDGSARQEFFELGMDVTNLPGGYRLTDDDDYGSMEMLARAFGKTKNSYYRDWRRASHNALARVTGKKELLQFVRDVEKTVNRQRLAQNHRMRNYLLACGLPTGVVTLYLHSGLYPKIIEDTYRYYLGLLEALRSTQWEMSTPTWKDSYVDQMIRHHSRELGQIRMTATDYRMHVLETYVYLRNAHKEKYQDPSFTRALLHNLSITSTGGEESTTPAGSTATGEKQVRCSHCRRAKLHPGTTKDDCPLKVLSASKAQKALQNLRPAQAKAVCKQVKDALTANPSADLDEVVSTARASV